MKNRFNPYLLCVLAIVGSFLPSAFAGGSDRGGGSIIVEPTTQRPMLLDFFTAGLKPPHAGLGDFLPETNFSQKIGFEFVNLKEMKSFKHAKGVAAHWKNSTDSTHARLGELMLSTLKGANFLYTFRPIHHFKDFYLPESLENYRSQVSTSVIYDHELGAVLDANAWNKLDLQSQAGHFEHEALRHLKVLFDVDLTEEQIQNLTAAMYSSKLEDRLVISEKTVGKRLNNLLNGNEPAEWMSYRLMADFMCDKAIQARHLVENTDHAIQTSKLEDMACPGPKQFRVGGTLPPEEILEPVLESDLGLAFFAEKKRVNYAIVSLAVYATELKHVLDPKRRHNTQDPETQFAMELRRDSNALSTEFYRRSGMLAPNEVDWADFRYPVQESEELFDIWNQLHGLKKDASGNPVRPLGSFTVEYTRRFSILLNDIFKERIGAEAP